MINVTGVKSGGGSAKLALHEGDQFLIERIAGSAKEPLGGGTPTILARGPVSPRSIAVDATSVYWITESSLNGLRSDGVVMKVTPK